MAKEFYNNEPLFLLDIDKLDRLAIQYCPLEVALTAAPNVQTVFVIGRNNPYYFYTSGEDTITLELDFHAQKPDFSDVKERCNWLRAKRYNNGIQNPAAKFKLVFGKLFDNEIWTIKAINIKYSQFKNQKADPNNGPGEFNLVANNDHYPSQAYVSLILGLDGLGTPGNYKSKNITRNQILPK